MLIIQLALSQTGRLFIHYPPLLSVPLTAWLCQHKVLHSKGGIQSMSCDGQQEQSFE